MNDCSAGHESRMQVAVNIEQSVNFPISCTLEKDKVNFSKPAGKLSRHSGQQMDGRMGGSAIGSKNVQGVVDKTDNSKCAPHIHSLKTELGKKGDSDRSFK